MAILHTNDPKKVGKVTAYLQSGNFCYNDYWYHCRVSFHEAWYAARIVQGTTPDFVYALKDQSDKDVVKLLTEVEDRLNLAEEDRMQLWACTADGGLSGSLYIKPSEWWLDPVRFTLLTCLLRNARGSLSQSLKPGQGYNYLDRTKTAVQAFVDGATFYHGKKFNGWVAQFGGQDKSYVYQLLRKTPSDNETVEACHHVGWDYYHQKLAKR